ncbi:TetR/AcrR family transcriptional regulator [Streptomyces sp. NPDC054794]
MLVWERPEPPTRPAPVPLSREQIVRAAIELADREGLEAVSLRRVAAVLDVGPMRLYRYLSTKEELLDLMVDAVYGEIPTPDPAGGDWREALRSFARGMRQAALRHEWFADLLGRRPHLGPQALANLEASLAALNEAMRTGDIDPVIQARDAVNSYVIGALRNEITERRTERATGLDEHQWQIASSSYLKQVLSTGRYPTLAKVIADARERGADAKFDTGLDFLLDGIAARLGV